MEGGERTRLGRICPQVQISTYEDIMTRRSEAYLAIDTFIDIEKSRENEHLGAYLV